MITIKKLNLSVLTVFLPIIFFSLLFFVAAMQTASAEGIFENKKKAEHSLENAEMNRIKAEYQLKFAAAKTSNSLPINSNPWDKKKSQQLSQATNWGECRDYALHKRKLCYRQGQNAYRCEQIYEARVSLCDGN